ncbi:hypothetical protein [Acidisoma cladoniae]|jgi:cytochrome c556|uniref:hypothetical protein n=1 Tax=Acidisoma cladoniae TaxID=3040935 RepID=UPI00254A16E1|nr:hypothetical protein [Acidisoma sp. PAMC 29798]
MASIKALVLRGSLLVGVVLVPVVAFAALQLSPIMRIWHTNEKSTEAMLSGQKPYDEGQIRSAIQIYIGDANRVAGRIKGNSSAAQDLRARFLSFASDASSAFKDSPSQTVLEASFARMTSDCSACHAVYKN